MKFFRSDWGALHVEELEFSPGWNFIGVEFFLGYMSTSTRVENKNSSTQVEIKNTICSIFIRHDL